MCPASSRGRSPSAMTGGTRTTPWREPGGAGAGLRHHRPQVPGQRVRHGDRACAHRSQDLADPESALYGRHPRQTQGGAGGHEEGHFYGGGQVQHRQAQHPIGGAYPAVPPGAGPAKRAGRRRIEKCRLNLGRRAKKCAAVPYLFYGRRMFK